VKHSPIRLLLLCLFMTHLAVAVPHGSDAHIIHAAIESQRLHLQVAVERTQSRLRDFEERYNTSTATFLATLSADDLSGGDMDYIDWAGEAQMLAALQNDIATLEYAQTHIS
jgi:hypothetical protein